MKIPSNDKKSDLQFNKAYNKCLRFLTPRIRSIKETKNYLKKKRFSPEIINKTIKKLKREHLLDDKAFACMFVESREKFKPKSKFALSFELRQKGIDDNIIDYVLKDINELESAWSAVRPKLKLWQNQKKDKLKNKIFNYLRNRGFGFEITSEIYGKSCRYIDKMNSD